MIENFIIDFINLFIPIVCMMATFTLGFTIGVFGI